MNWFNISEETLWPRAARKNKAIVSLSPTNTIKAQFRRRASAVPNLIVIGSTVARQENNFDSDVVPESNQIQDSPWERNLAKIH